MELTKSGASAIQLGFSVPQLSGGLLEPIPCLATPKHSPSPLTQCSCTHVWFEAIKVRMASKLLCCLVWCLLKGVKNPLEKLGTKMS